MTDTPRRNIFEQQLGQTPEDDLQTWVDTMDWDSVSQDATDGVWLVYGITTKPYPLTTCKTKLEAEQWVQMNQRGKVIFWPTGTLFEELDIQ